MADAETLPPAALALKRQQQGHLLMVSVGCPPLYSAADWGRGLPSPLDWLCSCAPLPSHAMEQQP